MSYHAERDRKTLDLLEEIKGTLPPFCRRFFLGVGQTTTPLTRLNYAYDLRTFFNFLRAQVDIFIEKGIQDFTMSDMELITTFHIELFAEYLSHFKDAHGEVHNNHEQSKMRKLSTLRTFFAYFFKKEELQKNVLPNVALPKIHEKPITRLDFDEIERLLTIADDGSQLSPTQLRYHHKTALRDTTILIFFLSTGVRISELVGLNVEDINLDNGSFKVTRKGGAQTILFAPEELQEQLELYLQSEPHEKNGPLFRSLQNKRISVRAVQNLVKKYAQLTTPLKNISPHKLRSTFGTNLYRETQDIYVVADVLGHKDVNTTKKHYAAISEDVRRAAATKVKLRSTQQPDD